MWAHFYSIFIKSHLRLLKRPELFGFFHATLVIRSFCLIDVKYFYWYQVWYQNQQCLPLGSSPKLKAKKLPIWYKIQTAWLCPKIGRYCTKELSVLKSDNLGRLSHWPSIWWSKYYFDRLKIKKWVAGLNLERSKLFIVIFLKL